MITCPHMRVKSKTEGEKTPVSRTEMVSVGILGRLRSRCASDEGIFS